MALEAIHGLNFKLDSSRYESSEEIREAQHAYQLNNPFQLFTPSLPKDQKISEGIFLDESGRKIKINFDHGTTTLGFKFQNGVILAADSRATAGQYIGSGRVRKLIPINQFLVGTMAGGAADCTYWERVLSKQCRIYELRNRERISVAAASKLLANMLYQYKGYGLSLGVMIGGMDKKGSGLYYVDNDGNRLSGNLFSAGSGSLGAYSILDSGYSFDMTDEEAYELARRSVYQAAHRDAASGGIIRVMHITQDGWKTISEDDFMLLHDKYQGES